ncbi:DUF1707 domain-containing protein [Propioniciclava sinopodophylli]|uniref:DUF1707 domain-containing protein n=1 Tax=Propioniciclava sinopodophylli TaxID=1837344 RepID=UPI002492176A|nr:DUF1707 domain-containing protein [Propioniciclava sinopodophylli]
MAELPRSSKYRATPGAPLSDDERNRLVERLNAAFERGEVSPDDYPRLLDALFGATTLGEVVPVVEAVPGVATHDVPAIVEQGVGRPGELSEPIQPSGALVAKVIAGGVVAAVLLLVVVLALLL